MTGPLLFVAIAGLELAACLYFFPIPADGPSSAPPATAAELARDPWDTPRVVVPVSVTETTCESLSTDRYAERIVTRQRCASGALYADELDAFLRSGSPW